MVQGYRITEGGDLRVTEQSSTRISEQFHVLSSSLSSDSTLSGSGFTKLNASVDLTNVGSVLYAGTVTRPAVVQAQATSSFTALGNVRFKGISDLVATGSQQAIGLRRVYAETSLASTGTQVSKAVRIKKVSASYQTTGSISNVVKLVKYATFDNQQDNIIRLSELGDTRITEDGKVRVSSNANTNSVYGNIVVNGVVAPFKAVAYIKENGVWVEFDPYVRWGGDWTLPDKIYKNVSNRWKRVY